MTGTPCLVPDGVLLDPHPTAQAPRHAINAINSGLRRFFKEKHPANKVQHPEIATSILSHKNDGQVCTTQATSARQLDFSRV
jgi:hypothetical protein